jgi:hypothetical protein
MDEVGLALQTAEEALVLANTIRSSSNDPTTVLVEQQKERFQRNLLEARLQFEHGTQNCGEPSSYNDSLQQKERFQRKLLEASLRYKK